MDKNEEILMSVANHRINILFLIMQMAMGGSERLVHTLVSRMDRNLFNPSVAWFHGNDSVKEFKDLEVPLYHIPKKKRVDCSAMRMIGSIIRTNNIHMVNAHHFMSMVYAFYGSKISNCSKLIYTEHSEWEMEQLAWRWKQAGALLGTRIDAAIGISEKVSQRMGTTLRLRPDKLVSIPNGIDLERYARPAKKSEIKRSLGIADQDKVIGITANLKRIKNHMFLLQAFREVVREYDKARILIIGQGFADDAGNTEHALKAYVAEQGMNDHVRFLGYRSDVPDLLNCMDIFCLTSLQEGLPISLIEAMAAGLPIVGTDVEGIRDVIVPGMNGYLVCSGDVIGLKNVLLNLLRNDSLRQVLGEGSRLLAEKNYSFTSCLEKHQELFLSLVKSVTTQRFAHVPATQS